MVRGGLIVAAAAVVAVVAGATYSSVGSAAESTPRLAWSANARTFSLAVTAGGKRLTTVGRAAPITYTRTNGGTGRLTRVLSRRVTTGGTTFQVATTERGRRAIVSVRRTALGLRVGVRLSPSSGVRDLRVSLDASPRDHFLGTGQRDRWVDMRRTVVPLKAWNACGSSAPAPFFAGTGGFGAYLDSLAIGRIAFPRAVDDTSFACDLGEPPCSVGPPADAVRLCVKAASLALELYPGSPAQVVSAYSARVGRPRAPWAPHFALIKWRDRIDGPAELFDDIEQMRSRKLPIGWVILDNPWERTAPQTACFGALEFDPERYPDPAGLIRSVHERGVRFMLWISPQLRNKGCPPHTYPDGWLTGDDEYLLRDLSHPASRADFTRRLRALAALGVDGFKGDRADEVDLEDVRLAGGSGTALHNTYPRWYHEAVAEAMRPYRKQWASQFRTSAPGSSALVPGFVGGDRQHSWNGLSGAVRMSQTAAVANTPMWGVDVGGYDGGTLSAELFVRWAQFAALTPMFEVGGAGANTRFWELGDQTVEEFRRAATLHYELVPYLYELVRQASVSGLPPVRPLGLTWPGDERAWRNDLQFTLGGTLLAAPVLAPAPAGAAARTSVYLPRGSWVDVFTGRTLAGGRTVVRTSAATDFPLYLRAGSAIPFNFRSPDLWSRAWGIDDLLRADRQGWLVASGAATARARDRQTTLTVESQRGGRLELVLRRARREQQLLLLGRRSTCRVSVDARVLRRAASPVALRGLAQGWAAENGSRRGIVVKLRSRGTSRIVMSGCG